MYKIQLTSYTFVEKLIFMRKFIRALAFTFSITYSVLGIAQPSNLEGTWLSGSWSTNTGTLINRGNHLYYRAQTSATTGTQTVLFNTGPGNYNPKWVADNSTAYNVNTFHSNGARHKTSGCCDLHFNVTNNAYYTFIIGKNSGTDNNLSILETSYNPTNFTSVSGDKSAVFHGETVTVTANMAAALNSGEYLYLRYTANSWSSSTIVAMSFVSGSSYSADIPAQNQGTAVEYYVFSSNQSSAPSAAEADYFSLNIQNAAGQNTAGANFSYTVSSWTTNSGATNWSTASSWTAGRVPPTNMGPVIIDHSITLDQPATVSSLTINSGGTFDNGSQTLTVSAAGTITNSGGTFTRSTGTVAFAGTGTISGTIGFNHVTLAGGVNFSSGSTIHGNLTINGGGFVNTTPPTYASGSTLIYNTTGTYGRGTEWSTTTGAGYPHHVRIDNNTTLNLGANGGTGTVRQCAGNLEVTSGATLSLNETSNQMTAALTVLGNFLNSGTVTLSGLPGGDLILQGNFNDNGIFNANSRAVFFTGGNTQDIYSATNPLDIDVMRVNKSGGEVRLMQNLLVDQTADPLQVSSATSVINLNGFSLTIGQTGVTSAVTMTAGSYFTGNATSDITILGNGALGTLLFNQTTPGTSNRIRNLMINRGSSGSVTIENPLVVSGELTLTEGNFSVANTTFTFNGTNISRTSGQIDATNSATIEFRNTNTLNLPANVFSGNINNLYVDASGASVNLGSDITIVGQLNLTNGIMGIGSNTLNINGTYSRTNGFLGGNGSSNLSIGGSGSLGTLYFDQTSNGSTNRLNNFTFNRTSSGTLSLGNRMEVVGVVTHTEGTLTTGGNLHLMATGNTTYGQIAGTGTGSISGNVSMQMRIPGTASGWRNITSPLNGYTLANLNQDHQSQGFLAYFNNISPSGDSRSVWTWSESSKTWSAVVDSTQNMFGNAYNIFFYANSNPTFTLSGTYSAASNNFGTLGFTSGSNANNDGWHLLYNPYPSGIDWNAIDRTNTNANNQFAVWNATNGNYASWDGSTGTNGGARYIPPMHCFWVKVTATGSADFEITSTNRSTNPGNFFGKNNNLENYVSITAKHGVYSDQTVVYSSDSELEENNAGALKRLGESFVPNVWTLKADNKFASSRFNSNTIASKVVPVGFKFDKSASITFETVVDNLINGNEAWLEDKKTNTWHNLSSSNYTFDYTKGEPETGRFFIHYKNNPSSIEEYANNLNNWYVFNENGRLMLNYTNGFVANSKLEVMDMAGRTIYKGTAIEGLQNIPLDEQVKGVLMVRISNIQHSKTIKTIK